MEQKILSAGNSKSGVFFCHCFLNFYFSRPDLFQTRENESFLEGVFKSTLRQDDPFFKCLHRFILLLSNRIIHFLILMAKLKPFRSISQTYWMNKNHKFSCSGKSSRNVVCRSQKISSSRSRLGWPCLCTFLALHLLENKFISIKHSKPMKTSDKHIPPRAAGRTGMLKSQ